ncbi:Pantothenate kinase [Saliniradius amylolyticus]|uniref:Type III pantothenate kinase n=1 Tax=Saliniradius amylolyticus TaxID=2183582 RepID=A0A2S2DZY8_9ALTE|nr:type III pantothenate kinase [Saliniradius amylolyticus]AWL10919.1 Pantothenate kinase [Saliniradius amylolyticus]
MSVPYSALLLDVGNSRTKAAVLQKERIIMLGPVSDEDIGQLIAKSQSMVLAAVGNPLLTDWIRKEAQRRRVQCIEARVTAKAFGISCAYESPSALGIDRWLAILGAGCGRHRAYAVIDYGTAITCDFVDAERNHLGGWILPGVNSMRGALVQTTQNVAARKTGWSRMEVGQNTMDCVDAGCLSAAQGIIYQAREFCRRHFADFEVILCGGDAEQFWRKNPDVCDFQPDLIFKGMALFMPEKQA